MNKIILIVTLVVSFNVGAMTPEEILIRSDEVRGVNTGFKVSIMIEDFENDKIKSTMEINTYIRKISLGSAPASIVKFLKPPVSKGQVMLKVDNVMWMYSPNSRFVIRIPSQLKLIGNMSNGDVSSINYQFDYDVVDFNDTDATTYKMVLERKNPQATYPKIHYWIDKETFQPVKSEFYTDSDRLLKTMEFAEYRPALGKMRPYKIITFDGNAREDRTISYYNSYTKENLDDKYYQKNYLRYVP